MGNACSISSQKKGLNKSKLAGRLDMSRRTMYNLFEKENFSPDELDRVTKGLDMSTETFLNPGAVQESKHTDSEEMMLLREKYYKLLEEHTQLLKSHAAIKDELLQNRKELAAARKQK